MDDIEEKRVYDDRTGRTELLVAAGIGVVSVSVAAARVGRYGVVHRCAPADLATSGALVAVATDDDLLIRGADADDFVTTGFGPASAVGFDGHDPVVADPSGSIARGDDATRVSADGSEVRWTALGRLDADVRAIDGRLVAASDGVHRLPGLQYVGLDDAHDVAAAGPLAATGEGLYTLGNGWMDELAGEFRVVTATDDRGHATSTEGFYAREHGEWGPVSLPVDGSIVDVAYGDTVYAVTADGDLLAGEDGDWRTHPLGVSGVVGCAIA